MSFKSIVISSGHSKYVRGASCSPIPPYLDEVDEARKVVERVALELRARNVAAKTYHDDVSKTQDENLRRITDYHNSCQRELDVSCHFNANKKTTSPVGTEVWYKSQKDLAAQLSKAMASSGLKDRGAKQSSQLFFLNNTAMPAVLLEVAFVDSEADCKIYRDRFDHICASIANVLGGEHLESVPPSIEGPTVPPELVPPPVFVAGTCSHFGGPDDSGVSASEGLAFIYDITEENQWLFLPMQPAGTTGLARRLNIHTHYCAMRWDYTVHPKNTLLSKVALVRNPKTGFALACTPADWGPHEEKTGRLIDLSPQVMQDLSLATDDVVEVLFPYEGDV